MPTTQELIQQISARLDDAGRHEADADIDALSGINASGASANGPLERVDTAPYHAMASRPTYGTSHYRSSSVTSTPAATPLFGSMKHTGGGGTASSRVPAADHRPLESRHRRSSSADAASSAYGGSRRSLYGVDSGLSALGLSPRHAPNSASHTPTGADSPVLRASREAAAAVERSEGALGGEPVLGRTQPAVPHAAVPSSPGERARAAAQAASGAHRADRERELQHEVTELRRALLRASQSLEAFHGERRQAGLQLATVQAERDEARREIEQLRATAAADAEAARRDREQLGARCQKAEAERDRLQGTVAAADAALRRLDEAQQQSERRLKAAKRKLAQERAAAEDMRRELTEAQHERTAATARAELLSDFVRGPLRRFASEADEISRAVDATKPRASVAAASRRHAPGDRPSALDALDAELAVMTRLPSGAPDVGGSGDASLHSDPAPRERRHSAASSLDVSGSAAGDRPLLLAHRGDDDGEDPYEAARARIRALTTSADE